MLLKLILVVLFALQRTAAFPSKRRRNPTKLLIEAGEVGWRSIEFKELFQSAGEYLGIQNVEKIYPSSRRRQLQMVTHWFYDPRTGDSGRYWPVIFRAMYLGLFCAWRGITPIAYVTDMSVRRWRHAAFFCTAGAGLVVALMEAASVPKSMILHRRIVGPMPLAISKHLYNQIHGETDLNWSSRATLLSFVGSIYEPRTTFLREVDQLLSEIGCSIDIKSRQFGGERMTDDLYWSVLKRSKFTITTTEQIADAKLDFGHLRQLVYRYTEALLCGCCLLAQDVPGGLKLYRPWEHYVPVESPQDVLSIIKEYDDREADFEAIALAGRERAKMISESSMFWMTIDYALGADGFQRL